MATISCASLVNAQGFFAELDAGYGFSMAGMEIDYNSTTNDNGTDISWTDEVVSGSFGKGMNFGLNLGYMLNENFGLGLNTNYLMGGKYETTYDYTATGYSSSSKSTFQGKMIRLTPSVIVKGSGDVAPYARLGIAMGVGSKVMYSSDYSNSDGDTEKYSYELNQGMAFGASAEVGADITLSDNLSLLACVRGVNMSWSPNHGEITEYIMDGVDVMPQLTVRDKETNFVKESTGSTGTTPNESQPSEDLKFYLPFSSLGLNISLRYSF